jgi:UDP-N-acetylglucosamine diphosphorylase/glucosamine-1-phosphate N-acetyltransferase
MRERWERLLGTETSTLTETYLQPVFHLNASDDNLVINASVFATSDLLEAVKQLHDGEKLMQDELLIAARFSNAEIHFHNLDVHVSSLSAKTYTGSLRRLKNIWDIFSLNEEAIKEDFLLVTKGRESISIPEDVTVKAKGNLFIEEGAIINAGCIINASTGPVYIAKDAEILEGAIIRGPFALGEHGVVKMGAKIYGATTIGPGCKVGGEISNVVFFANSNKGHDGFLGNAVIGEWCNLGADTNCSNLKNNYDEVKIWDEFSNKSVRTGLQFCGLFMGDHSKCGINTMFNTGTVVGVSANVFGGDFPEKFIPSFCWGGSEGMVAYDFNRAIDTAKRMMKRRSRDITETEIAMYRHISDSTSPLRNIFAAKKN